MTAIVTMGVAGCGKTTVGAAIAAELQWPFADGDDHHPLSNRQKMSAGIPLDDDDRRPWLDTLGTLIRAHPDGIVISCSALKKRYREQLSAFGSIRFIYLSLPEELALARVTSRDHFFPASLVADQYWKLEEPAPGEAMWIDASQPLDQVLAGIADRLAKDGQPAW